MYFQFYNYLYISILFIHEFIKFYQYYPVFRKYYIETQQYTAFIKVKMSYQTITVRLIHCTNVQNNK